MHIRENESLKGKTTMRIGGTARYFAELTTKDDVEEAVAFAKEKQIPIIPLGGGSNTIFADGTINALVIRIAASNVTTGQPIPDNRSLITVESGKNLPMLINELAKEGLDLSALTGILGTVGGAIFGNAGQGPKGIWIDSFVESVEAYVGGEWKTFSKEECGFAYRESWFKHNASPLPRTGEGHERSEGEGANFPPIIWSSTLSVPTRDPQEIEVEIQRLLQKRIDTQPHVKTAGSCFKAVGHTPAWKLIDAAGLRETKHGGVHISKKHANFLINDGEGTFADALNVVKTIENGISDGLEVEMRFVKEDGSVEF